MTSLRTSVAFPNCRSLRSLTGNDELAVENTDAGAAIALLARLNTDPQRVAAHLTACERDRLLAGILARHYGNRVDSTLACTSCAKPFDVELDIRELLKRVMAPSALSADAHGSYCIAGGIRFRLPTGEDELSIAHLSGDEAVHELLSRCVLEAPLDFDPARVQDAMEQAAPLIDFDINTHCPECGAEQRARFDLQTYLLQCIRQERQSLWRETHLLASTYKWSLDEILRLERADRRTLVSLIESGTVAGATLW